MSGGVFAGLARFVVRYRIPVAAAWGAVLIAATLALPSLDREVNSDPSLFLGSAARSVTASSLGAPLLGRRSASRITIVAARTDGPLSPADVAAVTREATLARQLSAVTAVRYAVPVWQDPGTLTSASSHMSSSGLFASTAGPLDPNGTSLMPAAYATAHRELGNPARLPLTEPAGLPMTASVYDAYRASAQYVSADGRTVRFAAQLKAGDQQATAAMNATRRCAPRSPRRPGSPARRPAGWPARPPRSTT